jgi:hypothetical protein
LLLWLLQLLQVGREFQRLTEASLLPFVQRNGIGALLLNGGLFLQN